MNHFTSPRFRERYAALPASVQKAADKAFELVKNDPHHPSLHFKYVGKYRAIRIGLRHRALAVEIPGGFSGSGSAAIPNTTESLTEERLHG